MPLNNAGMSLIVFFCVFGGALLGIFLRRLVPKEQLIGDSKDVVKLGMGLVGTMVALVLGLLVASAKAQFDSQNNELVQISANVVLLDRLLAHSGPEASEARAVLRNTVINALGQVSNQHPRFTQPEILGQSLYESIARVNPQNDGQRSAQAQALGVVLTLGQSRWLMFGRQSSAVPVPLLAVLAFWLTITFLSFGLFAPTNPTVMLSLFVAALSVASAVFLILEMYSPQTGVIQNASAPLRAALAQLGR
jgi:hypothetical protein